MKAYHNYTTAMATAIRLRWGTATLLILAALIAGLMLILSTNGQSALPLATSDSFARHSSDPILPCRACRDEWVAAQAAQPVVASPTQRSQVKSIVSGFHASGLIASCRECRDEWVAAQAIQPAIVAPAQRAQVTNATSGSRPAGLLESCRECRDEWVAAHTPVIPTGSVTIEQPEEYVRTSGPR